MTNLWETMQTMNADQKIWIYENKNGKPMEHMKPRTLRDAVQAERTYKRKYVAGSEQPVSASACNGDTVLVKPWTEDSDGKCVKTHRTMTAVAKCRATDSSHLKRRVEEIGNTLTVPGERETAAVRLERLRQRIRTREIAVGAGKC